MYPHRSLAPMTVSLAAAAVTGLTLMAAKQASARLRRKKVPFRETTGGCTPDVGYYVNARILVHDVDGTNQGIAIALLRDRILPVPEDAEESLTLAYDEATSSLVEVASLTADTETVDLEYDEAIRSFVEVVINLAMEMADAEIDDACTCGDEDCEASAVDSAIRPLVAGRKLTEFAMSFETFASNHASTCRRCAHAGAEAPGFLRAKFCRDLADDLLTNFDSDTVNMRGIPIAAAEDVAATMIEVIEQAHGTPAVEQIRHLSQGVASAIVHKESHIAS